MRYDNYCLEGTVLFVMWPLSWNCVWTLVAGPNYLLKKGAQDKYKNDSFKTFLYFSSENAKLFILHPSKNATCFSSVLFFFKFKSKVRVYVVTISRQPVQLYTSRVAFL